MGAYLKHLKTDGVLACHISNVHFDLRRFAPEDVGWKALAVNLSDLAAAGAKPRWFLCALGIPRSARAMQVAQRMARGMAPLARRFGCALVGGNVTSAAQWSLTITALGEARRPMMRSGARPGDALLVAGKLGDAAAGLRSYPSPTGARAQRRPRPLVRVPFLFERSFGAHAVEKISRAVEGVL